MADWVFSGEHYLNINYGIRSWLLTVDHKRIALLYLVSISLFFFLGGAFAVLIRLELLTPQVDLVQAETYNKLFTMHGIIMIFFFLIPSISGCLRQFSHPDHDRGQGHSLSQGQPGKLLCVLFRGLFTLGAIIGGGGDTG